MAPEQFNDALLRLSERLYGYALRLTTDQDKARDLVQETYLKALTYQNRYENNTNLLAWAYTIMRNTFINDYRRKTKSENMYMADPNELPTNILNIQNMNSSPDSAVDFKEIIKAIETLEYDYKLPFTLFVEGYKYKEIAEIMKLPIGTVKSRIFFTRKKLAKVLRELVEV